MARSMKAPVSQRKAIRSQQVHTGPAGLNILELPEDASDEDIFAALANLETVKIKLLSKRKALAEDAQEVLLSLGTEIPEEEAARRATSIRDALKTARDSITDLSGIGNL